MEGRTSGSNTVAGLQSATAGQWHTANFRAVPPANAHQARFSVLCRNGAGAVDLARPCAYWRHYAPPSDGWRSADVLEYDTAAADWAKGAASRVDFLALPLWPADIDPGEKQTIYSAESVDGTRLRLTWDYSLGFQALLENSGGGPLLRLDLGQLHTLTRLDPCEISIVFRRGVLEVKLDAGADFLQSAGKVKSARSFQPARMRLGGDLFGGNSGWEGYYALTKCQGSN